jgi:hypothetical protein
LPLHEVNDNVSKRTINFKVVFITITF